MYLMRLLAVAMIFCALSAFASQELYVPPRSLNLQLTLIKSDSQSSTFRVDIESLIGVCKDVRCYFEGSEKIITSPGEFKLDELAPGQVASTTFVTALTAEQASNPNCWVKARVEYLPDFAAIRSKITADEAAYPDQNLRDQLLKIVEQNLAASARAVDAVRHFFGK